MITEFKRYEFKYLLHRDQARTLYSELLKHLPADPYSGLHGYWINSLYYDSPELHFFWAKVDGHRFRRKLRLRSYASADPHAAEAEFSLPVAVEIKQRLDQRVEKRRVFLARLEAEILCKGQAVVASDNQGQRVVEEVVRMVQSLQLVPTCLVRYHRRAFSGTVAEPDLRITFDSELSCRTVQLQAAPEAAPMPYFLPPEACVLEVKVSESMPAWLQQILSRHGCQLQRMSKYCVGLAQERKLDVLELVPTFAWQKEQAS